MHNAEDIGQNDGSGHATEAHTFSINFSPGLLKKALWLLLKNYGRLFRERLSCATFFLGVKAYNKQNFLCTTFFLNKKKYIAQFREYCEIVGKKWCVVSLSYDVTSGCIKFDPEAHYCRGKNTVKNSLLDKIHHFRGTLKWHTINTLLEVHPPRRYNSSVSSSGIRHIAP